MFRRRKPKFTLNKDKRSNLNDEDSKKNESNLNDVKITTSSKNDIASKVDVVKTDNSDVLEVDDLKNDRNEKCDDKVPIVKTAFLRRRKATLAPKVTLLKKNTSTNKNEEEKDALNEINKISEETKSNAVINKATGSKLSRRRKAVIAPKTAPTDVKSNSSKSKNQEENNLSVETEKVLKKDGDETIAGKPTTKQLSRRHKLVVAPKTSSTDVGKDHEESISQNESMVVSTIIPCDTNTEEDDCNHTSIQSIVASFNKTIEGNVIENEVSNNVNQDSVEGIENKPSPTPDDIFTAKIDCTTINECESTGKFCDASDLSHLEVNSTHSSLVSAETASSELSEDVEAGNHLRRRPTTKTRKRNLKNASNEPSERKHKIKVKKKLQEIEEKIGEEGKWPQLDYDVFSMSDFIYLNPTKSAGKEMGIRVRQREQQRKLEEAKKHLASIQESNKEESLKLKMNRKNRKNTSVPQLRVDEHGKIILDSDSIEVNTHEIDESQEIIDASSIIVNSNSYRRKPVSKRTTWSQRQTRDFYEAVKIVGLDFNLMKSMFKNRSEDELRRKYRLESKRNPEKIDSTLKKQHFIDVPLDKFTHSSSNDKNSSFVEDFKEVVLNEDKNKACQSTIGTHHEVTLPVIINISSPSIKDSNSYQV